MDLGNILPIEFVIHVFDEGICAIIDERTIS